MGGKKPLKHCGYIKPHPQHTWEEDGKYGRSGRKLFCEGGPAPHKHDWDHVGYPILQTAKGKKVGLGEVGSPWQGPYECKCGQSRWLVDGRVSERFPIGDPLERIHALRAKLARGKDEWTDEDQAELEAIGAALVETMKPMVEALHKLAEQMVDYMKAFFDRIDPAFLAELAEYAKSIGEKPDEVHTVSMVDADGELVAEVLLTPEPVPATTGPTPVVGAPLKIDPGYAVLNGQRIEDVYLPPTSGLGVRRDRA